MILCARARFARPSASLRVLSCLVLFFFFFSFLIYHHIKHRYVSVRVQEKDVTHSKLVDHLLTLFDQVNHRQNILFVELIMFRFEKSASNHLRPSYSVTDKPSKSLKNCLKFSTKIFNFLPS